METLSQAASLYDPKVPHSSNDPQLIVLLTWMAGHETHIAKYVEQHRELYSTSRILVVRYPIRHVFFPWIVRAQLAPAVEVIKAVSVSAQESVKANGQGREKGEESIPLLMHIFSNGGVGTAVVIQHMLKDKVTGVSAMPRCVTILDSCPGYYSWSSTHRALMASLPFWASPFLHIGLIVNWLVCQALRAKPLPDRNAALINSKYVLATETCRTYIYGTADGMVSWRDVEHHAEQAKSLGSRTRLEKFPGAKHVASARSNGPRYWMIISRAWNERDQNNTADADEM